jgi:probable rRNA maturation factor
MILISTNHPYLRFSGKRTSNIMSYIYRTERKALRRTAVIFTNNRYIKKINRTFLSHNYITDVIAFSLGKDCDVESEIYINLDAARSQALRYDVTYTEEVRRLLIHGILHLLGYDDRHQKNRIKMKKREDSYMEIFEKKNNC